MGDLVEDRHDALGVEWARAAHQLVEHGRGAEEVAAPVDDLAPHLLGRHVLRRPHHHARARDVAHGEAGHAEVHDLHPALPREEDVGGLDVAVHDAHLVRVGEALEDGGDDGDLALEAQGRRGAHGLEEVVPAEELHGDVGRAVGVVAEVEDGDHVGMHHARDGARLALEAVLLLRVPRDLGEHHLEGDVPLEQRVARVVHDAHRARPQAPEDLVFPDPSRQVGDGAFRLRFGRHFRGVWAQAWFAKGQGN